LQGHRVAEIPFAKSFAGHETFSFRYSWLKKGLDGLMADPEVFQREDAIVRLGVGKNMVTSIRHWCMAARVAEEKPNNHSRLLQPTSFGVRLLADNGWDPFLEDDGTLWLIHWNLASAGTRAATWYWAFNRYHEYAFTREAMTESLSRTIQTLGWAGISKSTIKRDVDCFVHTYLSPRQNKTSSSDSIECPLTNLDILLQEPDGERLRFRVGPKPSLPTAVFAYALLEFYNQGYAGRNTIDLREIMRSEGSPALIFKLDEESVLDYLDNLKDTTAGGLIFEDTALVRRVVKTKEGSMDSMALLEMYYSGK